MYNLTNLASSNCGWICILNNQKSCSNFILKKLVLYSIHETTSIKLNFQMFVCKTSFDFFKLLWFNIFQWFIYISSYLVHTLFRGETSVCFNNWQLLKKWFILFSTWLHAAVYALLPQKFSTNNHTTKKGNKEEVEPNLLALLSVKRELFFFTLFYCKCASVTLNRDESVFDSKGVGITTIFFNTQLF